jgi:hypothetical protein
MTSIVNNAEITFREPTPQERATLLFQRGQGNNVVAGGLQSADVDSLKFVFIDNGTGWVQRVTVDKNASEEEVRLAIANNQLGSQENSTRWNIVDSFGYQAYTPPQEEVENPPLFEEELPPPVLPPPVLPPPVLPPPPPQPPPQPPLVIPPVRVTSIANPPAGMTPLVPTVVLLRSNPDPQGTFRATSVDEMFTVGTSLPTADVLYEVGLPFNPSKSFVQGILVIRNNTTNTDLLVDVGLPEYLSSDSSKTFVIGADLKVGLVVKADLEAAKRLAVPLTQLFRADKISITVRPQNVTGPVFVRRELPPLTT